MEKSHVTSVCQRQWDDYEAPAGDPGGRPATPGPAHGMVAVEVSRRTYAQVVSSPSSRLPPPPVGQPGQEPEAAARVSVPLNIARPVTSSGPSCNVAPNVGQSASAAGAGPEGAFATVGGPADRPRLLVEISTKKSGGRTAVLVALADSGATTTLVTKQAADRVRLCIRQADIKLTGLCGPGSTLGEAYLWLQVAEVDMKERVRVIVVDELPEGQEVLLACGDLKRFGLIHPGFPRPPPQGLPASSTYTYHRRPMGLSTGGSEELRKMGDAFTVSELDSKPLTINRTLFRHQEDYNVHDIPGLDEMPPIIRETLLSTAVCSPTSCLPPASSSATRSTFR